jgi:hypothetical protein
LEQQQASSVLATRVLEGLARTADAYFTHLGGEASRVKLVATPL